jgi:8-oxo-dGTP diphosphatase
MENKFNIRVYGLLINHNQEILLSDEELNGKRFTKFPGGGLEFGEGLLEGLKREFMEECNMEIEINSHFYTTDFFVQSIFGGGQLIAVYYLVKPKNKFELKTSKISYDFIQQTSNSKQAFRFIAIKSITEAELTFPIDKHIVALLKQNLI